MMFEFTFAFADMSALKEGLNRALKVADNEESVVCKMKYFVSNYMVGHNEITMDRMVSVIDHVEKFVKFLSKMGNVSGVIKLRITEKGRVDDDM